MQVTKQTPFTMDQKHQVAQTRCLERNSQIEVVSHLSPRAKIVQFLGAQGRLILYTSKPSTLSTQILFELPDTWSPVMIDTPNGRFSTKQCSICREPTAPGSNRPVTSPCVAAMLYERPGSPSGSQQARQTPGQRHSLRNLRLPTNLSVEQYPRLSPEGTGGF